MLYVTTFSSSVKFQPCGISVILEPKAREFNVFTCFYMRWMLLQAQTIFVWWVSPSTICSQNAMEDVRWQNWRNKLQECWWWWALSLRPSGAWLRIQCLIQTANAVWNPMRTINMNHFHTLQFSWWPWFFWVWYFSWQGHSNGQRMPTKAMSTAIWDHGNGRQPCGQALQWEQEAERWSQWNEESNRRATERPQVIGRPRRHSVWPSRFTTLRLGNARRIHDSFRIDISAKTAHVHTRESKPG